MIENAALICDAFPSEHKDLCIDGAVDNILNFDDLDLTRTEQLCNSVDEGIKKHCFGRIGSNLINIAHSQDEAIEVCNTLKKKENIQSCLEDANIKTQ